LSPKRAVYEVPAIIALVCHNFHNHLVLHEKSVSVLKTMFAEYPEIINAARSDSTSATPTEELPTAKKPTPLQMNAMYNKMSVIGKMLHIIEESAKELIKAEADRGNRLLSTCLFAFDGLKAAFEANPEIAPLAAAHKLSSLCQGPLREAFEKHPEIGPRLAERLEPLCAGPVPEAVSGLRQSVSGLLETLKKPQPKPFSELEAEMSFRPTEPLLQELEAFTLHL